MARCAGITRSGERCRLEATASNGFCWSHDPATVQARKARARRGGKAGGNGRSSHSEIRDLRELGAELYREIRGGDVEPGVGAVLVQCINARARLIELSRRLDQRRELEQRIAELEARAEERWQHRTGT